MFKENQNNAPHAPKLSFSELKKKENWSNSGDNRMKHSQIVHMNHKHSSYSMANTELVSATLSSMCTKYDDEFDDHNNNTSAVQYIHIHEYAYQLTNISSCYWISFFSLSKYS